MEDATAGDPISGLKWTHKSLRKIANTLGQIGYDLTPPTVARLLSTQNYSLRVNAKRHAGQQVAGRDEQFHYIAEQRARFLAQGWPVISVDSKKKELIGNFRQQGREWRRQVREVNIYDFPTLASGKAIPYGIYDVWRNQGYVVIGTSHDTPEFAVSAIRRWWMAVGQRVYAWQRHLLINADCGGSNGNRSLAWKARLQDFADEYNLIITVMHYPTGASKWNPIEHRMFNLISANWAGQPLETYETMLKHIQTTTSDTGFRCQAHMDTTDYETAIKVPEAVAKRIRLKPHELFPHWNYTIYPNKQIWR